MAPPDAVAETSKRPSSTTAELAMEPAPVSRSPAPAPMIVSPVKPLTPERVSVPPPTISDPAPKMSPEKVPAASVRVRVSAPSRTRPWPERLTIEAPAVVPEMSKRPLSLTPAEWAIEPLPRSARVAPGLMVVRPA